MAQAVNEWNQQNKQHVRFEHADLQEVPWGKSCATLRNHSYYIHNSAETFIKKNVLNSIKGKSDLFEYV